MARTGVVVLVALWCGVASALNSREASRAVGRGRARAGGVSTQSWSAGREVLSTERGVSGGAAKSSVDVSLLLYFFFWYLGNYYYNITNKLALKYSGGSAGYPMTIASLQLGVGVVYALFAWVAPDLRTPPTISVDDVFKMVPVSFCAMMAHCASVFALSAGAVSFGQIVKAAEPAFAAVLSTFVYGRPISTAKWLCLIPVIGGVVLASVKELDFAVSALVSASAANMFAAIKGNENKKLMTTPGLKDRLGTVGNQFAVTTILAFLFSLPLLVFTEGGKFSDFLQICKDKPVVFHNLILSGLYFYGYNELATMTIKKTSAITQSVANTAKRVIIIIGVAIVLGESLPFAKLLGSAICIGGVFLYSIIDQLLAAY